MVRSTDSLASSFSTVRFLKLPKHRQGVEVFKKRNVTNKARYSGGGTRGAAGVATAPPYFSRNNR